ncbi:hypothetical protein B566_EDAN012996 [Ephemera danica]|nr:hypothetical protein B566_EDAN012996 [Ephemera danica]
MGMRSIYWKYFGFPGNDDGDILTREKIICTLCKIQMAYNGNTSNLRMHLQNKHPSHLSNLEATTPPYVPKSRNKPKTPKRNIDANPMVHAVTFDGAVELGRSSSPVPHGAIKFISIGTSSDGRESPGVEYITSDSLENAVTYYLPEDSGPSRTHSDPSEVGDALIRYFSSELIHPSIMDAVMFQRLVSKLNASFALPSTKQLEEEIIPQHYEDLKQGVMSEILSLSEYSLTVEEWKGLYNETFFTVSIHFLNEEQVINRTLFTLRLDLNHLEQLDKILDHWGLVKKRVTAIVAATSNSDLIENLEEWAPVIPCFLFSLGQAVDACFKMDEVHMVISSCRNILSWFHLQRTYDGTQTVVIKLDHPHLWTSTYEMLQEFSNNRDQIQSLIGENDNLRMDEEGWENLSAIVAVCSPFKITVQTLQEENPALLSLMKPLLWQLLTNYLEMKDGDSAFTEVLKSLLKSKLSDVYTLQNMHLQIATTLDPRFKQILYATEEEADEIRVNIKDLLAKVVQETGDTTTMPAIIISNKKKISGMEILLGELCSPVKKEFRPADKAALEFNQYTSEPHVPFDENPLTWWHATQSKCPNLIKLAHRYTCVPACAMPASRIRCEEREKFNRQRATLSVEIVDKMLFLNGNLI